MPCILLLAVSANVTATDQSRPSKGDPLPKRVSDDKTYGFVESNPIKVGSQRGGPDDSRRFLSALRGPEGQRVEFKRLGSYCIFDTPNGLIGGRAMLDKYEVTYKGLKEPIVLFVNMYDYEQPKVPVGFTLAK